MPKPWLALGGSVISLFSVTSLYLSAGQPQTEVKFRTSLAPLLSTIAHNALLSTAVDSTTSRWALPAYQDDGVAWQAQQTNITLQPADIEAYQKSLEGDGTVPEVASEPLPTQNTPLFITRLRNGFLGFGDRDESLSIFQPILQYKIVTVGFRPGDQAMIERYANRHHLSPSSFELQSLDPAAIQLLSGFRRVLTEDIVTDEGALGEPGQELLTDEESPQSGLQVAPGGGRYWIEDPNAAWW